ncbi:MAG TPA: hypothetical protein VGH23_20465 [Rhizomicrobium sp.]|jgi:hypothetical protein
MNFHPVIKACLDGAACGTVGASFVIALPSVATALTVVWMLIRIYETRTVQRIIFGSDDSKE